MTIDRAARARRRRQARAAQEADAVASTRRLRSVAANEVEGLFSAGARARIDQLEWVAVAKEDDRETAGGAIDLDSGVVLLNRADL